MAKVEEQGPADLFSACGQKAITISTGWKLRTPPKRRPICNRAKHHDGPHREIDPRTFELRAEFIAVYDPPSARWQ